MGVLVLGSVGLGAAVIVLAAVGVVIGVVLVVACGETKAAMGSHFGIALIVAGFLAVTINQVEVREIKNLLGDLREDILRVHFGHEIPRSISEEITDHIFRDPILYRNVKVNGHVTEDPSGEYVKIDIDQTITVENLSKEALTYHLGNHLVDVTASAGAMPQNRVTHYRLRGITNKNRAVDWGEEELRQRSTFSPDSERRELYVTIGETLAPREVIEVTLTKLLYGNTRDYYAATVVHPVSEGMELVFHLPIDYVSGCTFNHPGGLKERCFCTQEPGLVTGEVRAAVLPDQGILVDWAKRVKESKAEEKP